MDLSCTRLESPRKTKRPWAYLLWQRGPSPDEPLGPGPEIFQTCLLVQPDLVGRSASDSLLNSYSKRRQGSFAFEQSVL